MHGEPDIPIHPVAEGDVPSGSPSTGSYFGTLNTDPSTSFEPVAATLLSPRSTAPFKTGPASTAMRQSTSGETLAPSFLPLDTTLPNIIRFHPKESPSGDEDEEEEEEERTAPAAGRSLKKRKSVVSLRNAHAVVAPPMLPRKDSFPQYNGGFGTMSGMGEGEYGGLAEDEDKDKGRRKIQIEYIEEKSKRHITFSKRKAGIMKKAYELSTLTGTQVLLLVVSESGWVYTFTTDKFKPLVKEDENGNLSQGQKLIAACLEAKQDPRAGPVPLHLQHPNEYDVNGGQVPHQTRPVRPVVSNRRVSSSGKGHRPPNIRTDHAPPVPSLPSPLSGNVLAMQQQMQGPHTPLYHLDPPHNLSPQLSPGVPGQRSRSLSAHPASPHRMSQMSMLQLQQSGGPGGNVGTQLHSPNSVSSAGGQEYADMLHRASGGQYGSPTHPLQQYHSAHQYGNLVQHHSGPQHLSAADHHQFYQINLEHQHELMRRQQLHEQQRQRQGRPDELRPRSTVGLGQPGELVQENELPLPMDPNQGQYAYF